MPRKKKIPKYVVIKDGQWYVRKKLPGVKYPVWRICKTQTQEAVDQILAVLDRQISQPVAAAGAERLTVNQVFDEWLEAVADDITRRTLSDYSQILDRYFRPKIGLLFASDLHEHDLKTIFAAMKDQGLSPRTRQYAFTVVNSALKRALIRGAITANPLLHLSAPKLKKKELAVFNPDDAKRFFAACEGEDHGIIFQFALETGMRPEEYLALQWSDLDLKRMIAVVQRTVVVHRDGGGWSFEPPKTNKSRRAVKLSPLICRKLSDHRKKLQEAIRALSDRDNTPVLTESQNDTLRGKRLLREASYRLEAIENNRNYNLVFPSSDFTPFRINNLARRYLEPILTKAGAKKGITLKSLRHACATMLLVGGVNPKVVSERLGHASVVITLEIYSHVLPTMQDEASNTLAEMLH